MTGADFTILSFYGANIGPWISEDSGCIPSGGGNQTFNCDNHLGYNSEWQSILPFFLWDCLPSTFPLPRESFHQHHLSVLHDLSIGPCSPCMWAAVFPSFSFIPLLSTFHFRQ